MELALGTVQFGLDYGISNDRGSVPADEVARILDRAAEERVHVLDTAALYGRSEEVLGAAMGADSRRFRVITKTPHFKTDAITDTSVEELKSSLRESLRRLRRDRVEGLLIHQVDDVFKPGGRRLWETMEELRAAGLVEKIGVSVYSPEQTRALADLQIVPQLVQLPMNFLDQRFLDAGELARMKAEGTEIHVRSAFLQGLLFMDPATLGPHFENVRGLLATIRAELLRRGISLQEAAIAWMDGLGSIDALVLGVSRLSEWNELLAAASGRAENRHKLGEAWREWSWSDTAIVNPARWPARKG